MLFVVKLLLSESNIDVNGVEEKRPLFSALSQKSDDIMQLLLLRNGIRGVNAVYPDSKDTLLMRCCRDGMP